MTLKGVALNVQNVTRGAGLSKPLGHLLLALCRVADVFGKLVPRCTRAGTQRLSDPTHDLEVLPGTLDHVLRQLG